MVTTRSEERVLFIHPLHLSQIKDSLSVLFCTEY